MFVWFFVFLYILPNPPKPLSLSIFSKPFKKPKNTQKPSKPQKTPKNPQNPKKHPKTLKTPETPETPQNPQKPPKPPKTLKNPLNPPKNFQNHPTPQDVWAYTAAGIPKARIFIVNHKGQLSIERTSFESS